MDSPDRPLVLFAPAFGPTIGGGHLLRCLALAAAVSDLGARVMFAVPEAALEPLARFSPRPVATRTISPGDLASLCAELRPDAVVLDDYETGAESERRLRRHVRRIMVIDDLANRPHVADLLLDTGYGRGAEDYAGLVPPTTTMLFGPRHALLRPAFSAARELVGDVRESTERIFLSFGLSDVDGVTARGVESVRPVFPAAQLDVLLSSNAASLPELRRRAALDPRTTLHVDETNVAGLMTAADLAIGAGGSSTWERCCLGLPSIVLPVAENQRPTVFALEAQGVHIVIDPSAPDWVSRLSAVAQRLKDPETRRRLRANSMRVCDGMGAPRVAGALLAGLA